MREPWEEPYFSPYIRSSLSLIFSTPPSTKPSLWSEKTFTVLIALGNKMWKWLQGNILNGDDDGDEDVANIYCVFTVRLMEKLLKIFLIGTPSATADEPKLGYLIISCKFVSGWRPREYNTSTGSRGATGSKERVPDSKGSKHPFICSHVHAVKNSWVPSRCLGSGVTQHRACILIDLARSSSLLQTNYLFSFLFFFF